MAVSETGLKFMVDQNVGKLARWLRMMGYDSRLFDGSNDSHMVTMAVKEGRVLLTKDTQVMKRRVITCGRLKAVFIEADKPEQQICQVIKSLKLDCRFNPFAVCLECNHPLRERSRAEVENLVPPYVFRTQEQYMECPVCHRIYWRGSHWRAMASKLEKLLDCSAG